MMTPNNVITGTAMPAPIPTPVPLAAASSQKSTNKTEGGLLVFEAEDFGSDDQRLDTLQELCTALKMAPFLARQQREVG
jgi:hypothetical protein